MFYINALYLTDCWGRRRLISVCAPQSVDGKSSLLQSIFPNEIGKFPSASGKPNSDGCPDHLYLHGGERSCLESDVVLSNSQGLAFRAALQGCERITHISACYEKTIFSLGHCEAANHTTGFPNDIPLLCLIIPFSLSQ